MTCMAPSLGSTGEDDTSVTSDTGSVAPPAATGRADQPAIECTSKVAQQSSPASKKSKVKERMEKSTLG